MTAGSRVDADRRHHVRPRRHAGRRASCCRAAASVRAVFAGDATRPRLESAPITVEVVPTHERSALDERRARAGRAFAVSGTMSPAQPRVVCLLERQVGRRWGTVQRKRIAVSSAAPTRPRSSRRRPASTASRSVGGRRHRAAARCALLGLRAGLSQSASLSAASAALSPALLDALADLAEDRRGSARRRSRRRRRPPRAASARSPRRAVLAADDPVVLAGADPLHQLVHAPDRERMRLQRARCRKRESLSQPGSQSSYSAAWRDERVEAEPARGGAAGHHHQRPAGRQRVRLTSVAARSQRQLRGAVPLEQRQPDRQQRQPGEERQPHSDRRRC